MTGPEPKAADPKRPRTKGGQASSSQPLPSRDDQSGAGAAASSTQPGRSKVSFPTTIFFSHVPHFYPMYPSLFSHMARFLPMYPSFFSHVARFLPMYPSFFSHIPDTIFPCWQAAARRMGRGGAGGAGGTYREPERVYVLMSKERTPREIVGKKMGKKRGVWEKKGGIWEKSAKRWENVENRWEKKNVS